MISCSTKSRTRARSALSSSLIEKSMPAVPS
jgi:hypothetical protein